MRESSQSEVPKSCGPLAGRLLLDFSQGVAGPSCAMLLADLGADVIKIEPPEGDWARGVGYQVLPLESTAHLSLNRNKRSVCLDLRKQEGCVVARQLAQCCDILIQNFRPGVLEKFGLGYDDLRVANPRLIYASIFGYGEKGPLAGAPATDSTMQAFGGLMSINGDEGGPPLRMGNMVADMLAGSYLSQGVLAALLSLNETGQGQRVSVSLLDALIAFQAAPITEYAMTGRLPVRSGRRHPMIAPSGTYAVKDGFITLVATSQLWGKFCAAIHRPELAKDPRFATSEARLQNRGVLDEIIAPFFAMRTKDEALELARNHDLVCAPINDYAELLEHEQVLENQLVRTWNHDKLGVISNTRNPIRYDEFEGAWLTPPRLGEHTREVLSEALGLDSSSIDALISTGAAIEVSD